MNHYDTLEFNIILNALAGHALSETVKRRCLTLEPVSTRSEAQRRMNETTQAKKIIEQTGTPPLSYMTELHNTLGLVELDVMLSPEQLEHVRDFLVACHRMKGYLRRAESTETEIALYGGSINEMADLENEISRCIRAGHVEDRASEQLYDLRRIIDNIGVQIKTKLNTMLKKNTIWYSESFYAMRGGRFTLPVKKEYRSNVNGLLIELSNTGSTCFIEPESVRRLQDEISELRISEDCEVRRILYTLTALVGDHLSEIRLNIEAMEALDFLFAKAKLSISMKASPVYMTDSGEIRVLGARHPLIDPNDAVPLDFALGGDINGIVITGPNTGGKTVALKTVGLLSLMAQSGLHVPADERSAFTIRDAVLCDIGDGQSIMENLSTFSSHMTNILGILKEAGGGSLVLLDELGSGTDPAEGMGLAVAVLEELRTIGCIFVATTHYPEIKEYAANTPGLTNARMTFDRESLRPLYRLEIGTAGESCALYIAEKLGMPPHMLERARAAAYDGLPLDAQTGSDNAPHVVRNIEPLEIKPEDPKPPVTNRSQRFSIGDSVIVYPQKEIGIVCARANEKGEICVQIRKKKTLINHKRLKLKAAAADLYPEDYDFSIIFDSVETRKARHLMERKHVEGNIAVVEEGAKI